MGLFALLAVIRLNPNIHIEIRQTAVRTIPKELPEDRSIFPSVITFPLGHVMILFGEK